MRPHAPTVDFDLSRQGSCRRLHHLLTALTGTSYATLHRTVSVHAFRACQTATDTPTGRRQKSPPRSVTLLRERRRQPSYMVLLLLQLHLLLTCTCFACFSWPPEAATGSCIKFAIKLWRMRACASRPLAAVSSLHRRISLNSNANARMKEGPSVAGVFDTHSKRNSDIIQSTGHCRYRVFCLHLTSQQNYLLKLQTRIVEGHHTYIIE